MQLINIKKVTFILFIISTNSTFDSLVSIMRVFIQDSLTNMLKRSHFISELRSYPTRFNLNPDLSERVVVDLLKKNEIFSYDLSMTSQELQKRYSRIEPVGIKYTDIDDIPLKNIPFNFPLPSPECGEETAVYQLELDNIDYVVCLQGRSGFYREYQENADKFQLCPQNADSDDTIRRFMYSIMVA